MEQTRDQIQLSFGRLVDWQTANPLLLPGEGAIVFDNDTLKPIDIKFGNGISRFNELPSLVNNDVVYTKDEIDLFLSKLGEIITSDGGNISDLQRELFELKTVTVQNILDIIDSDANTSNPLPSLNTVLSAIKNIVNQRFGRVLTFGPNNKFDRVESLMSGPWYCDGEEVAGLEAGDLAEVEGYDYQFRFDGTKWEPYSSSNLLLSDSQEEALNSGITKAKVTLISQLESRTAVLASQIATLEARLEADEQNISKVASSAAHIYKGFKNTAEIISSGSGYSAYTPCRLRTLTDLQFVADGYIISVSNKGSIVKGGIFLFDTPADMSTEEGQSVEVIAEGGSGALCSITSVERVYDLGTAYDLRYDVSNNRSYLQELLQKHLDSKLSRGLQNNTLQMVRNGELTPVFVSGAVKYVDSSYTGVEEGLEFAPYKLGNTAINKFTDESEGTLVYAAGIYSERLYIAGKVNKNIVGQAVGTRSNTTVNAVSVDQNSSNIGFRDLFINTFFEVNGASNIYADNITVNGTTTINSKDFVFFSHCTFNGDVSIKSGTAYFDCCSFSDRSELKVNGGATVVTEGCSNVSPTIHEKASYLQLSGLCTPKSGATYAVIASPESTFVGLFGGVALTSDNSYAPISIQEGPKYALGSFLFNTQNSLLPSYEHRQAEDGIHSSQVFVGSRTSNNSGYTSESPYLREHLNAISEKLKQLATVVTDGNLDGLVSDVALEAGEEPATLKFSKTILGREEADETVVTVPGLGSAAFTDTESYATAEQGKLADTAYQKPKTGIPKSDLNEEVFTDLQDNLSDIEEDIANAEKSHEKLANKVNYLEGTERISDKGTDEQYPSVRLVYQEVRKPLAAIEDRMPETANAEDPSRLVSLKDMQELVASDYFRLLYPYGADHSGINDTDRLTIYPSIDTLNNSTTKFFLGDGTQIFRHTTDNTTNIHKNDRANYFRWFVTINGEDVEVLRAEYGEPTDLTGADKSLYIDATPRAGTPTYRVYEFDKLTPKWTLRSDLTDVVRNQASAIYSGGTDGVWKHAGDASLDLSPAQRAALNSGIDKTQVDKLGNIVGDLGKTVAEEILDRQMKIPAEINDQIVTHSGKEGEFGTPRNVTTGIVRSGTTVKDKDWGKLDYGTDTRAVPTSKAVSDLVTDVTSKVEKELAARDEEISDRYEELKADKEDIFPRSSGADKSGWPHLKTDGKSEVLTDTQMQDKLNSVLSADPSNEKYLSKAEAKQTYIKGETDRGFLILGTPIKKGGSGADKDDLVNRYFTPISDITYDSDDKEYDNLVQNASTDIPTVGAVVKDTINRVERLHSHVTDQLSGKQPLLKEADEVSGNIAHIAITRPKRGNGSYTDDTTGDLKIITSMSKDDGFTDPDVTDAIPTAGAVFSHIEQLQQADTDLTKFVKENILTDAESVNTGIDATKGQQGTLYKQLQDEISRRGSEDIRIQKEIYRRLLPSNIFKGSTPDASDYLEEDSTNYDKVLNCVPYFDFDESTGKIRIENSGVSYLSLAGAIPYDDGTNIKIESNKTYYPRDYLKTTILSVNTDSIGPRVIHNFHFVPAHIDNGLDLVGSYIKTVEDRNVEPPTPKGLTGVTFVDSTIALDLSSNYGDESLTFINSTVYLYSLGGNALSGLYTFINCRVFLRLLSNASHIGRIPVKLINSEVFLMPDTRLFVDAKTTSSSVVYVCNPGSNADSNQLWTYTVAPQIVKSIKSVDEFVSTGNEDEGDFINGLTVIYELGISRTVVDVAEQKFRCRQFEKDSSGKTTIYTNDTALYSRQTAKLDVRDKGSNLNPIYFEEGLPKESIYTIVPKEAGGTYDEKVTFTKGLDSNALSNFTAGATIKSTGTGSCIVGQTDPAIAANTTYIGCNFSRVTLTASDCVFINCKLAQVNLNNNGGRHTFQDCIISESLTGTGNNTEIVGGSLVVTSPLTLHSIRRCTVSISASGCTLTIGHAMTDCIISAPKSAASRITIAPAHIFANNYIAFGEGTDMDYSWRPSISGTTYAAIYGNYNGSVIF